MSSDPTAEPVKVEEKENGSTEPIEVVATEAPTSAEEKYHRQLQEIFGRVNEAQPLYEELGGLQGISESLKTDPHKGIPVDEVENRRELYGKNALPKEEPVTFWAILLNAWSDYMIIILAIAAVLSLILGLTVAEPGHDKPDRSKGWIEGVAIIISITLVTTISSINDYRKELKFRKLTEANEAQEVAVKRDGVVVHIDVTEIVVGDLLNINAGLVVPADGLYVHGQTVVIDESAVTGENDPKKKNASHPFILSGTVVNTAEDGWMLVCAVGETSFGGKLLMGSRGEGGIPATPLQDRLDDMAVTIGYFGMAAALILFLTLGIWEAVRLGKGEGNGKRYLDYFIISVAIVVVAVPEGLPLAVTISLAYSQSMMLKDNNQVRRLKACETMGNATQICSDKTGTLTQNLMSVVQMYITGKHLRVEKPGEFLESLNFSGEVDQEVLDLFSQALCLCSSSVKSRKVVAIDGLPEAERWVWDLDKGNKTDNALLDLADRMRLTEGDPKLNEILPHQEVRLECTEDKHQVFPFTSERKRMSVVVDQEDHLLLFVKGGSEVVFGLCDTILSDSGKVVDLTDDIASDLDTHINAFADEANRTVGIAFAKLPHGELPEDEPNVALTWIGLVGIQDPLRPEVAPAVEKCQHAGVQVRMCTGDNIHTAIAISKECGIFHEGDIAIEGKDFRQKVYDAYEKEMNGEKGQEELGEELKKITVVARCQPLDKQLLVLSLMLRGEIVAVTGDGTNDAPALKLAHVGFVMKSGTDIAVKSADIVLLDDNFRSVQRAVVWGRTVNDNIRKFLQLQLTVNVVSVLLTFIGSISAENNESPLSTVQLLWLNLIMDTFAALALATEAPNEACLNRGPVSKHAPLISRRMWCTILCQSAIQLTATLVLMHKGHDWFATGEGYDSTGAETFNEKGSTQHRTLVFNVFVWMVIFNEFNARKLYEELNIFEGFGRSKPFFLILLITVAFQVFAVEVAGDFMKTHGLTWYQWLISIAFGLFAWPMGVLSRFIPITEPEYPPEYDPEDIDDDSKEMAGKLLDDIEQHYHDKTGKSPKHLVKLEKDDDEKKHD